MPSPFPGMDPFIESQRWEGFHARMITEISDQLVPELRPTYVCDVQKQVFLISDEDEIQRHFVPDVHVESSVFGTSGESDYTNGPHVVTLKPTRLTLPSPLELEQSFLVIRTTQGREVVAVIEVLSPWNKSRPTGLNEYLMKRHEYFHSSAHVVEIDLLRGGTRLPCREVLPDGDFFAYVSRSYERPGVDVYSWNLEDGLPKIPIPLREGEADIQLNLVSAFSSVYERAGYDYAIDYDAAISPQPSDDQSAWISQRILEWRSESDQSQP